MKRIRNRDLIKIFFRSFYIQGSWNYERMMGLGLCFCLIPIARRLFSSKKETINFLQRHLDFFNSQPYLASFALGAITRLEEQAIQQKWKNKQPISIFKERICGPLGAIGDSFFWRFLKPFAALAGMILSFLFGWIGVLIFFILYNIPHIYIRILGIFRGYQKGFDIIRDLSIRGTQKYFKIFNAALSGVIGFLFIAIMHWLSTQGFRSPGIILFIGLTILSAVLTIRKRLTIEMIIIIILSISITFGLMIQ